MKPTNNNDHFDATRFALIDLHIHVDGSLSAEDVMYMAKEEGVEVPSTIREVYDLLSCPEDCKDLNRYLQSFDIPISVMQKDVTISYSVESLVRCLEDLGLIYAEIRFAPQQHILKGLNQEDVVKFAIEGLKRGLKKCTKGFKANLIISCMRGKDNGAQNMETVLLGEKYLGQGVCGIDLAGAEALYPTENFRNLFEYARAAGVPFTIHAGEAAGVESMHHAINFGTRRIGHGVRSYNDDRTKKMLIDHDVSLTLCPTSNMQTKALKEVTTLSDYPIQAFFDSGVSVNVGTDNMTVSNITLCREMEKLHEAGILTPKQAELVVESAISHSFISEDEKNELRAKARQRMNGN